MPICDRKRLWRACAFLTVALALASSVSATTYLPVTFRELVNQAEVIFVGDVVDVRPYTLRTRTGTLVKTRVTFRVDDAVYGTSSLVEVFDFLGGEAEGYGLAVEGMPKFAVGDREVVFAHRKASINPIVGFTQGVLRVRRDSGGVDRVFTLEGISLLRPESIGSPTSGLRMAPESSMTLSDFRSRIVMALAEARKR
ncbi:MAG: hypothetical protein DMF88_04190 [Acidobacteria bacterium]|nr:MAG: hypothetical protein DMF88_04190 [Acidobacteriota bacterium]